jgi:ankyrin repeat protein
MTRTLRIVLLAGATSLSAAGTSAAGDSVIDAVRRGDRTALAALLAPGAGGDAASLANATEPDGTTALHWAAQRNDLEAARLLLARGASAGRANRYGVQPISLAAVNGNGPLITLLLDAGATPDAAMNGEPALMTAARSGSLAAVRALLDRGTDPNVKEPWRGQTALMWAAAEGHAGVVRELTSRGADLGARSTVGFTALLFAARQGKIDTAMALLDAGASINDALLGEARSGTAGGAYASPTPDSGVNAFLLAAGNAHFELAARLLDRGADPNAAPRGWTALHQVSWVRKAGIAGSNDPAPEGSGSMTSLEFVRVLVSRGADVNARVARRPPAGVTRLNMIGATPLLLAARTADAELMTLLVELGGDPALTNEDGTSLLMVAAGVGTAAPGEDPGTEPEVLAAVALAMKLGGDVNAVDKNGETAMHGAAAKHAPSVVRYLAGAGARQEVWNRPNKEGFTPLRITEGIHRSMSIISSPATAAVIREVMAQGTPAESSAR